MKRLVNLTILAAFVGTLAACATQPPAAEPSYAPPARKLDAKTQLETGRTR